MTYLLIWLAFDLVVYLIMWYDSREHKFTFMDTLRDFKESITQDE